MNRAQRWWRHLTTGPWTVRRHFPNGTMRAIEDAIAEWERQHSGELRFAVEAALPWSALAAGVTARERAIQVFADLHVWDTEHNHGVLIYLLLAERDVEIVADRGVAGGRVTEAEWAECCRLMEGPFREGRFQAGVLAGIRAVEQLVERHPPVQARPPDPGDELPNAPALL